MGSCAAGSDRVAAQPAAYDKRRPYFLLFKLCDPLIAVPQVYVMAVDILLRLLFGFFVVFAKELNAVLYATVPCHHTRGSLASPFPRRKHTRPPYVGGRNSPFVQPMKVSVFSGSGR